jgi:hypothetical protein
VKLEHDPKHKQVVITKGSLRIRLSKAEFDAKTQEAVTWYKKRAPHYQFDKYHGSSALMYDPESPFPKQFNVRVCERWKSSNSKNGQVFDGNSVMSDFL